MVKTVKLRLLFLSTVFFISINTFAQTIVPEYGEISISPDNFITGIGRRGAMDVQKSTGKQVYVYTDKDADPATTRDVWCVIYNFDMTVLVSPFRVNKLTANDQLAPTVLVNQNDDCFYVSWYGNSSGNNEIYAKKITFGITSDRSSIAAAATDILINDISTGDQIVPLMAMNYTNNELLFGFRDLSGNDGGGSSSQGVYFKRFFPSDLSAISSQTLVNSTTTGNQVLNAMDFQGNKLVITYTSDHLPAYSQDLYLRVYQTYMNTPPLPTYTPGSEILVNSYRSENQNNSYVTINSQTGNYTVTWSSSVQDGSGFGAYAKVYASTGAVIKDEFIVNSVTTDNELLSRAVWEESTNQLIYFFHYSNASSSTLKYRIFDGLSTPGQYTAVEVEKDLIGGTNTSNVYSEFYNVVYNSYSNRLNVVYEIFDSFSTYNTKSKARTLLFKHPLLVTPYFVNSTDLNKNWVHTRSYAEDGSLRLEARQYYDSLGNPTQSQVRNVAEGRLLTSAPVYDVYLRPVLKTLPAPITEQLCTYKNNFINPAGGTKPYSYLDFDKPATASNLAGEINNPKQVSNTSILGSYYSENNAFESYVASTAYPYSRVDYNDSVAGGMVRSSSPGEMLRMGSSHETKAVSLPVLNELDHYLQLKKNYFGASDSKATTLAFKATKTIKTDENGHSAISFQDNEGMLIATASDQGSSNTAQHVTMSGTRSSYSIQGNSEKQIYDIKVFYATAPIEVWAGGNLYFKGYADDFNVLNSLFNYSVRIFSDEPFDVKYEISVSPFHVYAHSKNSVGTSLLDFYLKDPSSLSLTYYNIEANLNFGTPVIKVSSLADGKIYFNGHYELFSNAVLPAGPGFYRIQIDSLPYTDWNYDSTYINIKVNFNFPYSDLAYYFYDLKGRMIGSVAPKGVNTASTAAPKFKSTYTYSTIGTMLSATDPDAGLTEYVYRADNKLRFMQDARQRVSGKFSYINYDASGRVAESGEYDPSLVGSGAKVFMNYSANATPPANPNSVHTILSNVTSGGGLESAGRTDVNYLTYDLAAGDALRTQHFTRLRTTASWKKNFDTDATYVCKTWYSYDNRGRLEWMDQSLTGLGSKTTDYTYNRELLTNVVFQKNTTAERFEHKYSYDAMQRLKKVESAAGAGLYQTEAQYYYYLHGPLKRKELGGTAQGMDYVYTAQGWLKSINHPELSAAKDPGQDGAAGSAFAQDVFGMSFDYYNGDYTRTGVSLGNTDNTSLAGYAANYNGLIRAINWQTAGHSISGNPAQYAYAYDYKNQLTSAVFGYNDLSTKNFVPDASGNYSTAAAYDYNGNLTALNTIKGAQPADLYSYSYGASADVNKLYTLTNSANAADSRTYSYDEIGRLVNETRASGKQKKLTYNAYGLVIAVKDSADRLVATFVYNERNQRIKKINYTAGTPSITTWYIIDASGNEVSIYDNSSGSTVQSEMPLYGSGRLGVVQKNGSTLVYTYEIKDHLGNVRGTVDRTATLLSWIDYLPFGEVNPERHAFSAHTRRSEYQGDNAQYDAETEWNSFDLRMYDARIGRWLSMDPYGQHWSPYMAMGNNPINFIDPSGGEDEDNMILLPEVEVMGNKLPPPIVLGLNYQNGVNPFAGIGASYNIDDIRSTANMEFPVGVDYSGIQRPRGSDFWQTHMGRDLSSIGEYFSNTKDMRELNDAVSTVANGGKVLGLGLMAFGATAPTGAFIAELSGTVSTITDGADAILDFSEGKFVSGTVKTSFVLISAATGGIISRSMTEGIAQTVTSTVSDMVLSGLQSMSTSQIDE